MMSKGPNAKGWQDYKLMNPVSRQIEPKSMFLQRFEDVMVGFPLAAPTAAPMPTPMAMPIPM